MLPSAFGSAYVGEAFSCTLCANNELATSADRLVTSVKIVAEMQTPSQTLLLEPSPDIDEAIKSGLGPGESLQRIIRFDLREEGSHVLVVNVTYSETILSRETASSGRVRSFRKLYQFVAQPCLSVRTKASTLSSRGAGIQEKMDSEPASYALEAQLENLADGPMTLESLRFDAKSPFISTSLNWDILQPGVLDAKLPTLSPREVFQVAFLINGRPNEGEGFNPPEVTKDGRTLLGALTIRWRSAMGDPGTLSTGWLTSRKS